MNFATAKNHLLTHDADLPQRDILLDSNCMNDRLAARLSTNGKLHFEDFKIARVKYRFGENLRVLYDVKRDGQSLRIASRTFSSGRGASVLRESLPYPTGSDGVRRVFLDDELDAIFWTFPNDRKIENLHVFSQLPRDLSSRLPGWTSSRLVAYAPEKCATAQCLDENDNVIAYAKIYAGNDGLCTFNIYKSFYNLDIKVPHPLAYFEKYKVLILEAITGGRLSELAANGSFEIYEQFGQEIGRLHAIKSFCGLQSSEKLSRIRLPRVLRNVRNVRPDCGDLAASVVERLQNYSFSAGPAVLLHGDVHEKNVIGKDGKVTLIDFDQLGIGDPACDIGSFLAGLHYKECIGEITAETRSKITENFVGGYESVRRLPEPRSLRWHTSAALFAERVLRSIHRVRVDGLEKMPELLRRSTELLF